MPGQTQGEGTRMDTTTPPSVATRLLVVAAGIGLVALVVAALPADTAVTVARAVVVRYGAFWVALSGVVLLGLYLVRRQGPPPRRDPQPKPGTRPRLTLVTSEPRA